MFSLSKKTKGFFIDVNGHAMLMARTSSVDAPMVVEELREIPVGDDSVAQAAVRELPGKKGGSGYLHASCGVYLPKQIVRRVTLDLKRAKEPGYFAEVCTQQFRVEADKCTLAVLHSGDGGDYDVTRATTQKEVVFVGGQSDEFLAAQERLLSLGIFPERLELSTVATFGLLANYQAFRQLKAPTLVLEIGPDATQSFIVGAGGLDVSRSIPQGLEAMLPIVQKELNLKDEESARKLFYSNTFDFTNMGGQLTKKLLKELQSLIGYYEVQTGQSIGQVFCTQLPPKLTWLGNAVAKELGVGVLKIEFAEWLKSRGVTFADEAASANLDLRWVPLFGLMVSYDAVATPKT